ncbi:Meiotic sister chromatid recombination protein 1 [Wickerhamomyces ciferrii]|uniref:Meiotic sister chromatid recombination protein 1 n=1 Tax=Wickerhamomyces ciferrii (strain ATCC 14091 / BCRC 22168 / CBS 111 / JCM 3599 / NBRC 0793 / NRRL Y-1031 F-60-10) TaxID=1206466 RepID=K0KTN3_WICCF|nr:Meiotic sister chromatid recombination protein 1 [Wickerhamomyces ciferrii]CCH45382.1 Meiotic sister chromatid recombination protein 1 [Wickerhamomyces ciferrii]
MKLTKVLLFTTAVSAFLSSTVLDSWDLNDLKQYLSDNKIPFDEKKATIEEIKDLSLKHFNVQQAKSSSASSSAWYNPNVVKQKVLNYYNGVTDSFTSNPPTSSSAIDYSNIKNWIFATWGIEDLKKTLTKSNIKFEPEAKRDELVQLAKDHYNDIAKKYGASGNYPGDWLYSNWDKKSLKKWLDEYGIDYSSFKDSQKDLIRKVRENSYQAAQVAEEERQSILESLDLSSKALFDKAGTVRDDIFNTWSSSQLYKWLKTHQVDVEESLKHNKEELALLAQKHKGHLKEDVDYWSKTASKSASPFLTKSSDRVDNLINDTFFVGVESWSRDRLKAFLQARGVSIPIFATKYELIQLVKDNKFKPIQNFNNDYFFQGWSRENIQKWADEQNDAAAKTSNDILVKANIAYKSLASNLDVYYKQASTVASEWQSQASDFASDAASQASDYASQASNQASGYANEASKQLTGARDSFFEYWSDVELRDYLNSFGIYNLKNVRHEQLIDLAKTNTKWFITGANYDADSVIANAKLNGVNFWNKVVYYYKTWYNYVYYTIFH